MTHHDRDDHRPALVQKDHDDKYPPEPTLEERVEDLEETVSSLSRLLGQLLAQTGDGDAKPCDLK